MMNDFWLRITTRLHTAWEKMSPWTYAVLIVLATLMIYGMMR